MADVRRWMTLVLFVVGIFALVGLGTGLTGYMATSWSGELFVGGADSAGQTYAGLVMVQSMVLAFFVGPSVGTLTGLLTGVSLRHTVPGALVVSLVGTVLGFGAMVFVAVYVALLGFDGVTAPAAANGTAPAGSWTAATATVPTADQFADGDTVVGILEAGIPTGLVGGIAGLIGTQFFQ